MKTSRQISFPASQYLPGGFKIRLTCLPCLKAVPLSFSRLRNIETLSNLFRSVLLLSPGKWCFIAPIMHADVATQAAGCQPLYQGDDDEARLHIKVGGWVSWCVWEQIPVGLRWCVCVLVCLFFVCACVCVCIWWCVSVSVRSCLCECFFACVWPCLSTRPWFCVCVWPSLCRPVLLWLWFSVGMRYCWCVLCQ